MTYVLPSDPPSCTVKYDADGNQVWIQFYPATDCYRYPSIAVDSSGNVYVACNTPTWNDTPDFCTLKYDSNGNPLWARFYDSGAYDGDYATAIAVDPGGNVYVTGVSWGFGGNAEYCTINYDTNGNEEWVQRYDGGGCANAAYAIALDLTGNAYVTGNGCPGDYVTIKYGTNGWTRRFDTDNSLDQATSIAVDGDGNSYVTGYSGTVPPYEHWTVKYDLHGKQLWARSYLGPTYSHDYAHVIGVDASGNAYVTGTASGSGPSGNLDYLTIKYDRYGDVLWIRTYDGPGHWSDEPYGIAVDADGNAYVTGYSYGVSRAYVEYCTIKYDTDGNQVWLQRYGPTHDDDRALALAIDANGNVCVTGRSHSVIGQWNMATVMYTSLPQVTVTGNVGLDPYEGGAGISGTLEYRVPGAGCTVHTSVVTLDGVGTYRDPTAPQGTYDLACKFPNWLRQVVRGVVIGAGGSSADFTLTSGDAYPDNVVDLLDLSTVLASYGSTGTPPLWGDVTWDGKVNLVDLSTILANFGTQGDP